MAAWFAVKAYQGTSYIDLEKACHIKFTDATAGQPASASVYFDEDHRVQTDEAEEVMQIRNWVDSAATH
jgi:hypothetical protein